MSTSRRSIERSSCSKNSGCCATPTSATAPASFRLAEDEHVHVVCHNCGKVIDAPPDLIDELVERLRAERGFAVDRSHFTVFGTCDDCADTDR